MTRNAETQQQSTRVQLELPPSSFARLNNMKARTEATSYAELLKNALRLYENILDQRAAGRRLFLKEPDGTLIEYVMFER